MQVSPNGTPISETILAGNSLSVPSGEVWEVTVSMRTSANVGSGSGSDHYNRYVEVDGTMVAHSTSSGHAFSDMADGHMSGTAPARLVLVGGQTIAPTSTACHVSGFEVSGQIDNEPVSTTMISGDSVTVPSGESWAVTIAGQAGNSEGRANGNIRRYVRINGEVVASSEMDLSTAYYGATAANSTLPTGVVVTDGDTIKCDGNGNGNNIIVCGYKF